eukprot:248499-Rhodomonas_salina.1
MIAAARAVDSSSRASAPPSTPQSTPLHRRHPVLSRLNLLTLHLRRPLSQLRVSTEVEREEEESTE